MWTRYTLWFLQHLFGLTRLVSVPSWDFSLSPSFLPFVRRLPQKAHMFISNYRLRYFLFFLPQNISILVVLMYSWQISVNMKKYQSLGDVYYGEHWRRRKSFHPLQFPKLIWYLLNSFFHPFCSHFAAVLLCDSIRCCVGVQIAYYAIIFSQFSMMVLSVLLAIGVYTVSLYCNTFLLPFSMVFVGK